MDMIFSNHSFERKTRKMVFNVLQVTLIESDACSLFTPQSMQLLSLVFLTQVTVTL